MVPEYVGTLAGNSGEAVVGPDVFLTFTLLEPAAVTF